MKRDTMGLIIFMAAMIIFFLGILYMAGQNEYKVIEGNIIGTKTILNDDGSIKHMLLSFDNGEQVKVKFFDNEYHDLTKGSMLIVELSKHQYLPEWDYGKDVWRIVSILKVPSED